MIDLIVEEVRQARAEIAAEFGYDLAKYHEWLQAQQLIRKRQLRQPNRDKSLPTKASETQFFGNPGTSPAPQPCES